MDLEEGELCRNRAKLADYTRLDWRIDTED